MSTTITLPFSKASLTLDKSGRLTSLSYGNLQNIPPHPFLQIGLNGKLLAPLSLSEKGGQLVFIFNGEREVTLSPLPKKNYTVFTVTLVKGDFDHLIIGPILTSEAKIIGDIVGVVQGESYAVGIQALNDKTLAGFPAEYPKNEYVSNEDISKISVAPMLYSCSAAYKAEINGQRGSLLQLYCENRSRTRKKEMVSFRDVDTAPMLNHSDASIQGCSFALFCCKKENVLNIIGEIEIEEQLPHPMLNGEWVKTSRFAMQSYLIAEFNEGNFDFLIDCTKKAGFEYLYHPEPFVSWGHFPLRSDCFVNGDDSLKAFCERALERSVRIGLHTLSSFTSTNDSYVTPIPHKELAKLGGEELASDLSAEANELFTAHSELFKRVTSLQAVQIGDELIRYSQAEAGKLTGCIRGEFGTKAASHKKGEIVYLLCDHPYKVFFPNLTLQEEYTKRLYELFKYTGAAQISFDGLEGCAATGEDEYAVNRFCQDFYKGCNNPSLINDASRLNHNLWHMNTRMNWGEPWGANMREGMIEYRIKNQDFYRRNLFPRMLGWFLIRKADRRFEASPPEDIEWALSMAAGFDAGFALSTSSDILSVNGCTDELLSLIKGWETLRIRDVFSEEQKKMLCDPNTEWHLEFDNNTYLVYPLFISKPFVCDLLELQPGQPGGADWILINPYQAQQYELRVKVEGNGEIHNPAFITKQGMLKFNCSVKGGQYLWYRSSKAYITDRNYRIIEYVTKQGEGIVDMGQQLFSISCEFSGEEGPEVNVKVFTRDNPIIFTDLSV